MKLDNVNIDNQEILITPEELKRQLPATEEVKRGISQNREIVRSIIDGTDKRLLLVVGPCSIHNPREAIDYAERLKALSESVNDKLFIVMRAYFEKPRSTIGWKGLINDPHLDDSFKIAEGLAMARKLLLEISKLGLPLANEALDPITPQYLQELFSWTAIGARTSESQTHREMASGLSCPVGFKNGTDGNVQIAMDAVSASRQPHHFLSVTKQGIAAIVQTKGNDGCHLILRGSKKGPNFDAVSVQGVCEKLEQNDLNPSVMVDCSHGNSAKDHRKQPTAAKAVAAQIAGGSRFVMGVMLESHLIEGQQSYKGDGSDAYGQSITDACISWEQTIPVLEELAGAVRQRLSLIHI